MKKPLGRLSQWLFVYDLFKTACGAMAIARKAQPIKSDRFACDE
ncbi:MAG: hypothetical protein ACI8P3_002531 [Saprospiraceae bacterium]|jgi:hypothetical protein